MLTHKKIRIGKSVVEALAIRLISKNFILLKGRKGYVMCGYLDLRSAEKFGDAAVRVTGVSTISQAVNSTVSACTSKAKKFGIRKGQAVKEALKLLA